MLKNLKRILFWLEFSACLILGFSLLTLPSQNSVIAQALFQLPKTKKVDLQLPPDSLYPEKLTDLEAPILTATAAAVLDRKSGVFLYTKNPDLRLLPASTVKIMTAMVALEHYSPLQALIVPEITSQGQKMNLVKGEIINTEALLYGLLVTSANDAGEVLAKNFPGGETEFVKAMNKKADSLSLKNTFYVNPTGLDNEESKDMTKARPFSSVRDLSWLADYALRNNKFAQIVATREITLKDPQGRFLHQLTNLNELLWKVPQIKGIKTGWTEEARQCLVTFYDQGEKQLIIVILGSEDRFGESKLLLDWVLANFVWKKISPLG